MPNYTTNLNLTKPLVSELYDINVQNENMDKIDEVIGTIPVPSTEDTGKFLRVNVDGAYALETVPSAEEASF